MHTESFLNKNFSSYLYIFYTDIFHQGIRIKILFTLALYNTICFLFGQFEIFYL
jgi:hypothetical protein